MSNERHEKDIEILVLESMVLLESCANTGMDKLRPEYFATKMHRDIFTAMQTLYEQGTSIDHITLRNYFPTASETSDYITNLLNANPIPAHFEDHCNVLLDQYKRRKAGEIGDMLKCGKSSPQAAANELLELEQAAKSESTSIRDIVQAARIERKDRIKSKHVLTGIETGISVVNSITGGWQPATLNVIAGETSHGKTALAIQFGLTAARAGKSVLIMSLEMKPESLANRMLANLSGIDANKIQCRPNPETGGKSIPSNEEKPRLRDAERELESLQIAIDANAKTVLDIRTSLTRHSRRRQVDLLIVDYLQIIEPLNSKYTNRTEQIAQMSRALQRYAHQFDIPILLLSQLNRNADKPRPSLARLRGSGAIEQDADTVFFVWRPTKSWDNIGYNEFINKVESHNLPAGIDKGNYRSYAELICAKNRDGNLIRSHMAFNGSCQRFTDWESDIYSNGEEVGI